MHSETFLAPVGKAICTACAAFIIFSVSAAARYAITDEVPQDPTILGAAAFGWPIAIPALLLSAFAFERQGKA